jgi:hypothetical protein
MVDVPPPPEGFQLVEGDKPKDLSLGEKTRNFMEHGSTKGPGHYSPEDAKKFEFPPWLDTAGKVALTAETGIGLLENPETVMALGKQLAGGKIGKFVRGIGEKAADIAEERKAASDPDFAKLKKSAEDWKPGKRPNNPKSSGAVPDHGPAPSPKGPPSKAQAVSAKQTDVPVEAPKTSRTVRATPEKQSYSDLRQTKARLQASMTHAQNLFKAGQTAEKLKSLNPAEKKELMVQIFGRERPEVWNSMIDDLRGLETGRVKPIN